MKYTGERQVITELDQVRRDHRERYEFAINTLSLRFAGTKKIKVADAACGAGYGTYMMNSVVPIWAQGFDISEQAVAHARKYFPVRGKPTPIVGDLTGADFKLDKDYDCVVSFETIEHVVDDALLLRRFYAAAPLLIGSVPNEATMPWSAERFPFHVRHYYLEDIETALRDAGYKSIEWHGQRNKQSPVEYDIDKPRTRVFVAHA